MVVLATRVDGSDIVEWEMEILWTILPQGNLSAAWVDYCLAYVLKSIPTITSVRWKMISLRSCLDFPVNWIGSWPWNIDWERVFWRGWNCFWSCWTMIVFEMWFAILFDVWFAGVDVGPNVSISSQIQSRITKESIFESRRSITMEWYESRRFDWLTRTTDGMDERKPIVSFESVPPLTLFRSLKNVNDCSL